MNQTFARLKSGLYMATQSFSMLWYQKKLLLYFGIPAFITFLIRILFQNDYLKSIYLSWPSIFRVVISMLPTAIMTFFTIALMRHTAQIMNGITSTIKNSLKACMSKIGIILAWMVPTIAVQLLISFIGIYDGPYFAFVALIISILLLLWLLYTFFVLPIITYTQKSLPDTIRTSAQVTRHLYPEILGGEIWFAIVFLLTALPLILYGLATQKYEFDPIFNFIVIFTSEIIINACISTAHSIFKVMLYQEYMKKAQASKLEQPILTR